MVGEHGSKTLSSPRKLRPHRLWFALQKAQHCWKECTLDPKT